MSEANLLDADELFHLALKASDSADHEKAIKLLKQSIDLSPRANSYFILAAEHAEIGMYPRAISEMDKAIELDPNLWTAHFQKGLLYLVSNSPMEAIQSWEALEQLEENHFLRLFKNGLKALIENNPEQAKDYLQQGIAQNLENPALNKDMEKVLGDITQTEAPESVEIQSVDENKKSTEDSSKHLLLSLYDKNDDNTEH